MTKVRTHWPFALDDSVEHAFHLALVFCPPPTDKRHAHGPEAPAQERHPAQFSFRKPSASAEHAGFDGQMLYEIEVGPFHMVGNDNGAFTTWQFVSSGNDVGFVRILENALDSQPD